MRRELTTLCGQTEQQAMPPIADVRAVAMLLTMSSHTTIVAQGMDRICDDFSQRIAENGFTRTKKRLWMRVSGRFTETIYFHRLGSSYGTPRTPSIDLRVILGLRVLNETSSGHEVGLISDHTRRPNGYAYHHRFNAETWSTYERCLEELLLFVHEVAEPWFCDEVNRLSA